MVLHRRRFFQSGLAAAASVLRGQNDAPNIIFLLTDDQRWDTLGCMGNRIIQTPNIDRLASQGVTFENHFVTTSICMTSRASIFTGLYARSHGITNFARSFDEQQFTRTYPQILKAAGYHIGFIGKYGVGNKMPADRFDYWRGFPGQGKYFPDGEPGPHLTERMGDQALQFLDSAPRGKPFCLSVSFKAAHVQDEDPRQFLPSPDSDRLYRGVRFPTPATADPKFISQLPAEVQRSENRRRWAVRFGTPELYQTSVRNYYRLISEVDTVVGRVREQLRRIGADRNTVIAFSGDNGFYLAEHGLAGKWLMHEESIRVPMILYDPRMGESARGARRNGMTLNIDIAPTLLEAAGAARPEWMHGRSLYGLARDASAEWRREWFYEHRFAHDWIPQTEGVRTERWKYTRYVTTKPEFEELFDLDADPREERNLREAAGGRDMLARLRARRETWLEALADWTYGSKWADPRI
ncbi:MAG: sulfatase [Bryobacteraceae bacterium]